MIIASWNVNSIKARLPHLQQWLATQHVDVLLLQELKGETPTFPASALQSLGFAYQQIVGEKSYNGVAMLSRAPITDKIHALPGDSSDDKARFVGGKVNDVWIYNLYAPNGNPIGSEKFSYKLAWLQRLEAFAQTVWARGEAALFAGDFNIIPTARDAKTPAAWVKDALYQPESRAAFARLANSGWADAYRAMHDQDDAYTFFDYRAGAWQKNDGIRIDHFLVSPEVMDRTQKCWIDPTPRGWDTPSDHVPILLQIDA